MKFDAKRVPKLTQHQYQNHPKSMPKLVSTNMRTIIKKHVFLKCKKTTKSAVRVIVLEGFALSEKH
jgi:hypothetical protein